MDLAASVVYEVKSDTESDAQFNSRTNALFSEMDIDSNRPFWNQGTLGDTSSFSWYVTRYFHDGSGNVAKQNFLDVFGDPDSALNAGLCFHNSSCGWISNYDTGGVCSDPVLSSLAPVRVFVRTIVRAILKPDVPSICLERRIGSFGCSYYRVGSTPIFVEGCGGHRVQTVTDTECDSGLAGYPDPVGPNPQGITPRFVDVPYSYGITIIQPNCECLAP